MTGADPSRLAAGSLRLRFMLAIMLWVALGIGGIWFSATRLFARHVEMQFHEELEVHVRELARLTRISTDGRPELVRPLSDPRYEVPLSGYYWQVSVPGAAPLRSPSMTRGVLEEQVAHSAEILHVLKGGPTGPAITYGFLGRGPHNQQIHYVIATDKRELDRVIAGFSRELSLWLAVLGVLLLATGLAVLSFGLRPLDRLGTAIARLRRGEVSELEGRFPAEIAPLAEDLNAYVRQNAEMIARARVQAANLAHSLRTPLAVIIDEAERMAERPRMSASAQVLLDHAGTMEQQIEYQLARARASAGPRAPGRSSRLPELVTPILRAMERLHPDKQFAIDSSGCREATLPLDPVDLGELLSILLDNAGKWSANRVDVALECTAGGATTITIADDGPGMSPDQLAKAFEIGTRFDHSKPGSGLGLAIARDIADSLGLELELVPNADGLKAIVRFGDRGLAHGGR